MALERFIATQIIATCFIARKIKASENHQLDKKLMETEENFQNYVQNKEPKEDQSLNTLIEQITNEYTYIIQQTQNELIQKENELILLKEKSDEISKEVLSHSFENQRLAGQVAFLLQKIELMNGNQKIFNRSFSDNCDTIKDEFNNMYNNADYEIEKKNSQIKDLEMKIQNMLKTFNSKNNSNRKQQENSEEPISCVFCGKYCKNWRGFMIHCGHMHKCTKCLNKC